VKLKSEMEEIFKSSLLILQNIETQFTVDALENKEWDKNDHVKFWIDFDHLTLGLKHEVNKLALLVDVNDKKKPNNEDVETLCKSVEQICVTLWSNFLRLSTRSGQTLCQCISTSCKSVIRSTCELLENLSKCSKRHESLQKVGEVWQTYDEIKAKIPRDNVQAVNLKIQDQRNLVQDALSELEDSKKIQCEEDFEDEDEKWSEAELSLLAPSMGLIKTANATLKRIQTSLKQNGNPYELKSVQDMDSILSHCEKISPLVDDLALPLYPPMSLDEVENESKNLSKELIHIINSLKTLHFVTEKECEEWVAFLLKAIDHNITKINVALANEKLKSLKT